MTPEKAIEILDTHQCDMPRNEVPDLIAALKLGIEALKWRRQMELDYASWCGPLLPGETGD